MAQIEPAPAVTEDAATDGVTIADAAVVEGANYAVITEENDAKPLAHSELF